ncbi:O-antigen ligase family protein [Marinagarivorans algicola]|uniref:O-antigen ligase family protein n=1 Tax=Marinagarivorans algicola TaxID=1513270 RepID=UPI0006B93457|nr:O-antigen ligase family protein [Marinagarivorans algicola]
MNKSILALYTLLWMSLPLQVYSIDVGFSLKPYMVMACLVLLLGVRRFRIHSASVPEITLCFFYIFYMSSFVWSTYIESSIRMALLIVINIFCFIVIRFTLIDAIFRMGGRQFLRHLSISYLFVFVVGFVLYVYGVKQVFGVAGYEGAIVGSVLVDKGIPRFVAFSLDPNICSLFLILPLFYFLFNRDRGGWVCFLFMLALVLATWSRAGFAALIMSFFFVAILSLPAITLRKLCFVIFLCLVAVIAVNFVLQVPGVEEMLQKRIDGAGRASGRFSAWSNAIEIFQENWLFGIGLYSFLQWNIKYFGDAHHVHNMYLDILVESGVVGATLYLIFVAVFFFQILLVRRMEIFSFLVSLSVFSFVMVGTLTAATHEGFIFNIILIMVLGRFYGVRYNGLCFNTGGRYIDIFPTQGRAA